VLFSLYDALNWCKMLEHSVFGGAVYGENGANKAVMNIYALKNGFTFQLLTFPVISQYISLIDSYID